MVKVVAVWLRGATSRHASGVGRAGGGHRASAHRDRRDWRSDTWGFGIQLNAATQFHEPPCLDASSDGVFFVPRDPKRDFDCRNAL